MKKNIIASLAVAFILVSGISFANANDATQNQAPEQSQMNHNMQKGCCKMMSQGGHGQGHGNHMQNGQNHQNHQQHMNNNA